MAGTAGSSRYAPAEPLTRPTRSRRLRTPALANTRHDGEAVTIPVVSIWRVGVDDGIEDCRVFYDVTPVFAPG